MLDYAHDRIIVTGGAGFLGQHVCDLLRERGVTDDRLCVPRSADCDLTAEANVARLYAEFPADVVIHLAAEVGGIGANAAHPGRFFYANWAMGLHLIEHARRTGVRHFVHCGTVCAYPEHAARPFTEDQFWTGYPAPVTAPYGIAKLSLALMLDGYRREYGLSGCTLIPVNLYGPKDNFDLETAHVMPALIRKFIEAKESGAPSVEVWGTGKASREFLYITDAAAGLLAAAEKVDDPTPINLGSGIETPIAELVERIAAEVGYDGQVVWDTTRPDGQPRRCLSTERSRALLDWQAAVALDQGVGQTVAWYRRQRAANLGHPDKKKPST